MTERRVLRVLLFLGSGFEDLEAATFLDVLGWTEYRDNLPRVEVATTGLHDEMRGRFGMTVKRTCRLEEVRTTDFAALAIPGGFYSHGYGEVHDDRLRGLAREVHAHGGTIATMCVGAVPVAEAGLLKGRRATCYPHSRDHDHLARLRELGATIVDAPVVADDRVISCAGPAQAMEVALLLLESLIGEGSTREVKRYMGSKVSG